MKKQTENVKIPKDDRQEIVVTSAMKEAGACVLSELSEVVTSDYLAEQVYIAMANAYNPKDR